MKPSSVRNYSSKHAGFTLVELLVVIGIIAILAAVLTTAASSAFRAAKRAKAQTMANQIQTGCQAYFTEYSVYPVITGSPAGDFYVSDSSTNWKQITEALCGNLSPYNPTTTVNPTVSNTRGIAFLSFKATDVDPNDCPLNPLPYSTANLYFNIVMDSDYSGIVGDSGSAKSNTMPDFVNSKVGTMAYLANGTTGGIAVWANCNTTTTATSWNPNFIVHTY
jgi:prepilin-type N-terminal cleavage/methylation domain-containing protein